MENETAPDLDLNESLRELEKITDMATLSPARRIMRGIHAVFMVSEELWDRDEGRMFEAYGNLTGSPKEKAE